MHAPQTLEAKAEWQELLEATRCLIDAKSSKPAIAVVYDSLLGAYKLTDDSVRIDNGLWDNLIMQMERPEDPDRVVDNDNFYERLDAYGINPRSGKALFSYILPQDFNYTNENVNIINGVLVSGRITKKHIGGKHNSIVQKLNQSPNYGRARSAQFITDISLLMNEYLTYYPFTILFEDCFARGREKELKKLKKKTIAEAELAIQAIGPSPADPIEREIYERQVKVLLDSFRDLGGKIGVEALRSTNNLSMAVAAESKGSDFNIAQMTALIGQQYLKGSRPEQAITGGSRCLPTFDPDSLDPASRGFICSNFTEGMNPTEFFFHMYAGREGLIDTATGAGEQGAMNHRLIKHAENIHVAADGTVRDAAGHIISWSYGNDGFAGDGLELVKDEFGNTYASFINMPEVMRSINRKYGF